MPGCDRLRTSVLIELPSELPGELPGADSNLQRTAFHLLVDTTTDLRQQALRYGIARIDAVIYTHAHADHIFGIDELRSFNFINRSVIPLYASDGCATDLERIFSYALQPAEPYEGGAVPQISLSRLKPYIPLVLAGSEIVPLPLEHGRTEVFGYRIKNFAYLTDCSAIPEGSRKHLQNLDVLILDGLRHRPHSTHFTLEGAVREIERLKPKQSYLIHLSHEIDCDEGNEFLRSITKEKVELSYDGLLINL
jgi:phosphoribosyl 1,2-cyclic phosphate phosphodiesterase